MSFHVEVFLTSKVNFTLSRQDMCILSTNCPLLVPFLVVLPLIILNPFKAWGGDGGIIAGSHAKTRYVTDLNLFGLYLNMYI